MKTGNNLMTINKKAVQNSLQIASMVHKAFLRELDQSLPEEVHSGQISFEGLLFPTFKVEVQS